LLKSKQEDLRGHPMVVFINEPGVGGGGLAREWLTLVTKELTSAEAGLFKVGENKHALLPKLHASMGPDLRDKYKLLGIMVASSYSIELPQYDLKEKLRDKPMMAVF